MRLKVKSFDIDFEHQPTDMFSSNGIGATTQEVHFNAQALRFCERGFQFFKRTHTREVLCFRAATKRGQTIEREVVLQCHKLSWCSCSEQYTISCG